MHFENVSFLYFNFKNTKGQNRYYNLITFEQNTLTQKKSI